MTVTYANLLRLADIATGTEVGTWGDITDVNICDLLAQAVTGASYIPVAADNTSDQIVTALNGALDEARSSVLNFTGTLSVTKAMIIPNSVKLYHVFNSSTGGGTIVLKPAAASATVSIPQGQADIIYCDGTNTYSLLVSKLARYLPLTGGTISGQLIVQDGGLVVNASSGAGVATAYLQAFYGNNAALYLGNTHGPRWVLVSQGSPESGGNTGSDFTLNRLDDSGAFIGPVMSAQRSTGRVVFPVMPQQTPAVSPTPFPDDLVAWRQIQSGVSGSDGTGNAPTLYNRTMSGTKAIVCTPIAPPSANAFQIVIYNDNQFGFTAYCTLNGTPVALNFFWIAIGW